MLDQCGPLWALLHFPSKGEQVLSYVAPVTLSGCECRQPRGQGAGAVTAGLTVARGREGGRGACLRRSLVGGRISGAVGCHETQHPYFFTWRRLTDGRDCRPRAAPGRRGALAKAAGRLAQLQVKWLGGGRLGRRGGELLTQAGGLGPLCVRQMDTVNTHLRRASPRELAAALSLWGAGGADTRLSVLGGAAGTGPQWERIRAEALAWSPVWARLSVTGWAVTARPQPFLGTSLCQFSARHFREEEVLDE